MKTYDELLALITQHGVHPVFGDEAEGWGIEHSPDELAQFLVVCQELGVESVLEVGTNYRAGLSRLLHDDLGWQVTSVDIHGYGHEFTGITFIHANGVDLPILSGKFDLVLLAGDHSYEGVQADYTYYGKYASKVIALHNIMGLRECEGVARYWVEIAHEADGDLKAGYHVIIADDDPKSGIGYRVLSELEPENVPAATKTRKPHTTKKAAK